MAKQGMFGITRCSCCTWFEHQGRLTFWNKVPKRQHPPECPRCHGYAFIDIGYFMRKPLARFLSWLPLRRVIGVEFK